MRRAALLLSALLLVAACGNGSDEATTADRRDPGADAEEVPEVVDATATADGDGTYRFDVTISSPYETPERYADAWRVVGPDGEVYGVRELTHDHADEQPFTRSLDGVAVPDEVTTVEVEAHDLVGGWSGQTLEVELDAG